MALLLAPALLAGGCGGGGVKDGVSNIRAGIASADNDPAGGNQAALCPGPSPHTDPLSGKIIFYSTMTTGDGPGFYLMNADGSSLQQLYATATRYQVVNYYDNGNKILAAGHGVPVTGDIVSIDLATGNSTTIHPHGPGYWGWYDPDISADGTKIVYFGWMMSLTESAYQINVSNIDGSSVTTLTEPSTISTYPTFSPDGSRVLYSSTIGIYEVSASGGAPKQIIAKSGLSALAYSPDGCTVAFITDDKILKTADYNGANVKTIYTSESDNLGQSLRFTDSDTIVFQKDAVSYTYQYMLLTVNVDESGVTTVAADGSNWL